MVLTAAVVALSVALSVRKTEQNSIKNTYAACPRNWIAFGNKCFYFSEYSSNWTSSQAFCMAQEAQLALIDSLEELNFLRRYKGIFDHWIGLHRESSEHPWKWTDNTEYNNMIPIQGVEIFVLLGDSGLISSRDDINRHWICSKSSSYTLQCKELKQFCCHWRCGVIMITVLTAAVVALSAALSVILGKKLQEKLPKIVSPESPAKLYCCYGVITVLTAAVVVLSVALSVRNTEQISIKNIYATCPRNWIGFGNKCFYFSEYASNWTFSQAFCMAQGAQLARIDNQEELTFLGRYTWSSSHWIGLHRDSSEHTWRWTDGTKYMYLVLIRGEENCGFLSDRGLSSSRDYINRKWICSKSSSYTLLCQ
ncbi:C-type lectin domain family 2 member G-like [Grammomys surdaster]|uniref:C-type lectin domain family 2 member G-like n=1 Tax=Grammomys surdaster TaxID=491861 RepID=UPI00109FBE05|nr:C-type lectin domain family 2 member G-like [Grammomys surdaster]